MESQQPEPQPSCPQCGAALDVGAEYCPLCRREFSVAEPLPALPVAVNAVVEVPASTPIQFSLASMLMLMTLTAVVLSVSVILPGLGIALAVVAIPALLRTAIRSMRRRQSGVPMTMGEKVTLFLLSLALATLIAVVTVGTFFAVCFGGFFLGAGRGGDPFAGFLYAIALGSIAALTVLILLIIYVWNRKKKVPPPLGAQFLRH